MEENNFYRSVYEKDLSSNVPIIDFSISPVLDNRNIEKDSYVKVNGKQYHIDTLPYVFNFIQIGNILTLLSRGHMNIILSDTSNAAYAIPENEMLDFVNRKLLDENFYKMGKDNVDFFLDYSNAIAEQTNPILKPHINFGVASGINAISKSLVENNEQPFPMGSDIEIKREILRAEAEGLQPKSENLSSINSRLATIIPQTPIQQIEKYTIPWSSSNSNQLRNDNKTSTIPILSDSEYQTLLEAADPDILASIIEEIQENAIYPNSVERIIYATSLETGTPLLPPITTEQQIAPLVYIDNRDI